MKNFLEVLWGPDAAFEISQPFSLKCNGVEASVLLERLRVTCPNPALRTLFAGDNNFDRPETSVCFVTRLAQDDGSEACGARATENLTRPSRRQLLLFALLYGVRAGDLPVVFPELFEGNPIVLVPNGTPLLCTPTLALLRSHPVRVLARSGT